MLIELKKFFFKWVKVFNWILKNEYKREFYLDGRGIRFYFLYLGG